jgi:thiamine-phosphate pyrophosphorylase
VHFAERLSSNRSFPIRILVNDRLDVAIAERAHGVHLGEKSFPVREAKQFIQATAAKHTVSESFFIGASCHSLEAAEGAEHDGADYIFFGPVFATPSKAAFGPPQGLERLAKVCRSVSIPVLAIGGITAENANSCLQAGVAGLAAIRLFQENPNLADAIRHLRRG